MSKSGVPRPKGEGQSLMISDFLTADWGHLHDDDRCVFTYLLLLDSHRFLEKHALFSSQGRAVMAGFQPMTCSIRLNVPLISLRASQKNGPRACFSLTMHQAIKSVQRMHSQLAGCPKVHIPTLPSLQGTQFSQAQRGAGPTSKVAHTCAIAGFLTINHNCFISLMITLPCLDGLRVCISKFGKELQHLPIS